LSAGVSGVRRSCCQKGRFSPSWSGAGVTDVGREQARNVVGRLGGGIGMDFGRTDPRLSTGDIFRPLELAGRIQGCPELWLDEQNAGGDDASEESEEYGHVGTRGGAHPGL